LLCISPSYIDAGSCPQVSSLTLSCQKRRHGMIGSTTWPGFRMLGQMRGAKQRRFVPVRQQLFCAVGHPKLSRISHSRSLCWATFFGSRSNTRRTFAPLPIFKQYFNTRSTARKRTFCPFRFSYVAFRILWVFFLCSIYSLFVAVLMRNRRCCQ
jgi:hypothetical protein